MRLTRFAKQELFRIHKYYEAKSPGLGNSFLDEVAVTLQLIKDFPHAWTQMGSTARRCRLRRFRYGVLYRAYEDRIVVFIVGHLSRKPSYWRKMLRQPEG